MDVVNIFRSFFQGIGGFMSFMNTPIEIYDFAGNTTTITPLTAFGLSLGVVLTIVFALHLFHLLNPLA